MAVALDRDRPHAGAHRHAAQAPARVYQTPLARVAGRAARRGAAFTFAPSGVTSSTATTVAPALAY